MSSETCHRFRRSLRSHTNADPQENAAGIIMIPAAVFTVACISNEYIHSSTSSISYFFLRVAVFFLGFAAPWSLIVAWAADSRAIGTRNGEQET